eukprot:scaffold558_cov120-Isochrysis_galbana.AAC.12
MGACCAMSSPLTSAPHTDARSPRTARSKNWMIFRKYPTYRLPSAYRWYSVPTKRPEAKQANAPEIFAIPAEDLREDKKSSQYLPSWDFRLFNRFADQPSSCRLCRKYVESSVHLGRCPSLKKIFGTINKTLGFTPSTNRNIQDKTLDTLFCFPHKDTPHIALHIYI